MPLAEIIRQGTKSTVRVIVRAALYVPQRPTRRHGSASNQVGESSNDLVGVGTVKKIIVQFPSLGAEGVGVGRVRSHVKERAVSIIEEDSVSPPLAHSHEERNGFVHRVGERIVGGGIGVPI